MPFWRDIRIASISFLSAVLTHIVDQTVPASSASIFTILQYRREAVTGENVALYPLGVQRVSSFANRLSGFRQW
jgi:hypothetical protein